MSAMRTSPERGRAEPTATPTGKGHGATPSVAHCRRRLRGEVAIGFVEPEQVLALDVEDEDPEILARIADDVASAGEHAQKEQRKRCLGGDPGDSRDRHVTALAAVEEVEVDEERLAVPAESDRKRPSHLVDVQRLVPRVTLRPVDLSPGSGATHTSGETLVTATWADRTFAAGSEPSSAMRNVSDSKEAPS